MPGPVYSIRLAAAHSGAPVDFVVPAGFVVVVRDVAAFNADAVDTNDGQLIAQPANVTIWQRTLGLQEWRNDEMRVVLLPGETLEVRPGFDVDLTVSGYRLALP